MADETTMQPGDDPGDYTVDQVNDYLATASDAERTRIYADEADGKARNGILGAQDATQGSTAPQTVSEAGEDAVTYRGDAYEKGYDGFAPSRDGDNPQDLTLQGVLKSQSEG